VSESSKARSFKHPNPIMEKFNEDNTPLVQVTPAGERSTCNSLETDRLLSQYVSVNAAEQQEELSTASSDSGSYFVGLPSSEPQQPVDPEKARMVASGTAGAVIGLLLGGSYFAALAGFGSAYATQKDGPIGDVSRAMGDVALHTRDKALEIDEKHQVVKNTRLALADAWEQAKELDRQHHILDKMKDFLIFSWKESVDFTRRHRLLERGLEAVGRGFEYALKRIFGINAVNNEDGTQTRPNTSSTDAPSVQP
jgi:hypothetical protein